MGPSGVVMNQTKFFLSREGGAEEFIFAPDWKLLGLRAVRSVGAVAWCSMDRFRIGVGAVQASFDTVLARTAIFRALRGMLASDEGTESTECFKSNSYLPLLCDVYTEHTLSESSYGPFSVPQAL